MAEFTEVESGRKNNRPDLARALAACKLYGATLVVAKHERDVAGQPVEGSARTG